MGEIVLKLALVLLREMALEYALVSEAVSRLSVVRQEPPQRMLQVQAEHRMLSVHGRSFVGPD